MEQTALYDGCGASVLCPDVRSAGETADINIRIRNRAPHLSPRSLFRALRDSLRPARLHSPWNYRLRALLYCVPAVALLLLAVQGPKTKAGEDLDASAPGAAGAGRHEDRLSKLAPVATSLVTAERLDSFRARQSLCRGEPS